MPYYFGVEIELIAQPRGDSHLERRAHYRRLAGALEDHGLSAVADKLDGSRYRKRPEYYHLWWITKDGSLKDPEYPCIPLEAVSPILTAYAWEDEVDAFWEAYNDVFFMPKPSNLCGSHVHISPYPYKAFNIDQLRSIAFGVVFFEPHVELLLPRYRRNNKYCVKNTIHSEMLSDMGSDDKNDLNRIKQYLWNNITNTYALREFMQGGLDSRRDRYVLWNFDNILPHKSGTIEFRGGRGLRGPVRTKRWIAFVLAFVHLCVRRRWRSMWTRSRRPPMRKFWKDLRAAAKSIGVKRHFPEDWQAMAESTTSFGPFDLDSSEDSDDKDEYESDYDGSDDGDDGSSYEEGMDSGEEGWGYDSDDGDYDDDSSIKSKGESVYSYSS